MTDALHQRSLGRPSRTWDQEWTGQISGLPQQTFSDTDVHRVLKTPVFVGSHDLAVARTGLRGRALTGAIEFGRPRGVDMQRW